MGGAIVAVGVGTIAVEIPVTLVAAGLGEGVAITVGVADASRVIWVGCTDGVFRTSEVADGEKQALVRPINMNASPINGNCFSRNKIPSHRIITLRGPRTQSKRAHGLVVHNDRPNIFPRMV